MLNALWKIELIQAHGLSADDYQGRPSNRENTKWNSQNDDQLTPEDLFEEATFSLGYLVKDISLETFMTNSDIELVKNQMVDTNYARIIMKTDIKQGRCYTVRLTELAREDGVFVFHVIRYLSI